MEGVGHGVGSISLVRHVATSYSNPTITSLGMDRVVAADAVPQMTGNNKSMSQYVCNVQFRFNRNTNFWRAIYARWLLTFVRSWTAYRIYYWTTSGNRVPDSSIIVANERGNAEWVLDTATDNDIGNLDDSFNLQNGFSPLVALWLHRQFDFSYWSADKVKSLLHCSFVKQQKNK